MQDRHYFLIAGVMSLVAGFAVEERYLFIQLCIVGGVCLAEWALTGE